MKKPEAIKMLYRGEVEAITTTRLKRKLCFTYDEEEQDIVLCEINLMNNSYSPVQHLSNLALCLISNEEEFEEVKFPVLDIRERTYLERVIMPFKDQIKYITKVDATDKSDCSRLVICYKDFVRDTSLFPFEKDTMYKGMELNRNYTLEELNLDK